MPIRLGLVEPGHPPEELRARYPSYPQMAADWLAPLGAEPGPLWPVLAGTGAPDPTAADLWVITGSRFGVYEDHGWIGPLEDFVRDVRGSGGKMVGICFGHQIIAQALGGVVRKSPKGWGIGTQHYPVRDWPQTLDPPAEPLRINAFHQDQVEELPEGAVVLAGSEFCPYGALWYPGFAVSFQGHPEFDDVYEADLVRARAEMLGAEAVTAALASLQAGNTRAALAEWLAAHLHRI